VNGLKLDPPNLTTPRPGFSCHNLSELPANRGPQKQKSRAASPAVPHT
jgi:hypothetical protein